MKKLEGGFINRVYLDGGVVVKTFGNDDLVGVSSEKRIKNEVNALSIFGGAIAPRLISWRGNVLKQEFIRGESYETRARRGEMVFDTAGRLLARIHEKKIMPAVPIRHYLHRFHRALLHSAQVLDYEKISPVFAVDMPIFNEWALRYIHGDYWLGNLLGDDEKPKVIDWEFFGIGSPFEDFAIAELWIFREFPGSDESFWRGYGKKPDLKLINNFLKLRCVEFLATTTLEQYMLEENDGFYHNKVRVLKSLFE